MLRVAKMATMIPTMSVVNLLIHLNTNRPANDLAVTRVLETLSSLEQSVGARRVTNYANSLKRLSVAEA